MARWFAYLLVALLLVILLVFTLLPLGIRWGVSYWFDQQGMDAHLQHLSLAPAAGRLELAGFSASRDGSQEMAIDELVVDINLLPLMSNRIEVTEFSVSGVLLNSSMVDRVHYIAGLDIQALLNSSKGDSESDVSVAEKESAPSPTPLNWQVAIESLSLNEFRLCAQNTESDVKNADVCVSWESLANTDAIEVAIAEAVEFHMPGTVAWKGFLIQDNLQELNVLTWAAFTFEGVHYNPSQVSVAAVDLDRLTLLQREGSEPLIGQQPSQIRLGALGIDDVEVVMEGAVLVDIQRIGLEGIDALVHRDSNQALPVKRRIEQIVEMIGALSGADSKAASASETERSETEALAASNNGESVETQAPVSVVLTEFAIKDSRVVYLDTQVQPQVIQNLDNMSLTFGPINTADVNHKSVVNLAIDVNEFSKLSLKGWVKPLTEKLNMDLDLNVNGYEPLAISPYVERALQYKIQRGQVNNSLDVVIENDQLDVNSKLVLEKFYLEDLEPEELAPGEKAQTLPVATAMNLLRDGDDRITIELPVSGDVADPSFSLSQVIGVVLKKALTQAVINYYTPFGLVNIASALADSATQLRFEPLLLDAGQSAPGKAHQERLQQLAGLLQAKQQLSLSFCPKVTGADALNLLQLDKVPEQGLVLTPEQQQQLKQLGIERGNGVKGALMKQGVMPSQVILCQPGVDLAQMTAPEIDISM